jgi:hypothetical protein
MNPSIEIYHKVIEIVRDSQLKKDETIDLEKIYSKIEKVDSQKVKSMQYWNLKNFSPELTQLIH